MPLWTCPSMKPSGSIVMSVKTSLTVAVPRTTTQMTLSFDSGDRMMCAGRYTEASHSAAKVLNPITCPMLGAVAALFGS
eukprot:CAMPEP_0114154978 /NCGR_PEP_ID=MMETSP0043_2-20121206/25210_1 /TAXON_ID=464988 /ORGANISM="Hemiselmis andersenii, Strain CCMP644" /LENGTH=78 /DNA_ID=CAMNT_0001250183 /DNA_START=308 /DNA_END=544 /DNA_ORIENTATION=-